MTGVAPVPWWHRSEDNLLVHSVLYVGSPGIELKLSVMFGHPSPHLLNLSFEIKSPPEPGEFYLGCLSTKSTGSTFPCIPITGDADHPTLSVFHMDAGDPDSALHTWAANT